MPPQIPSRRNCLQICYSLCRVVDNFTNQQENNYSANQTTLLWIFSVLCFASSCALISLSFSSLEYGGNFILILFRLNFRLKVSDPICINFCLVSKTLLVFFFLTLSRLKLSGVPLIVKYIEPHANTRAQLKSIRTRAPTNVNLSLNCVIVVSRSCLICPFNSKDQERKVCFQW